MSGGIGTLAQFLTILIIFLFVLALTWYSTRLIAKFQKSGANAHGNMEIVEAFRLSQTQVVEILRIADRYLAIAVSKDQVTKLGEWTKDELPLVIPEVSETAVSKANFKAFLEKYGNKKTEE